MKSKSPPSLKSRAIALLSRREHSRSELRRKLFRLVTAAVEDEQKKKAASLGRAEMGRTAGADEEKTSQEETSEIVVAPAREEAPGEGEPAANDTMGIAANSSAGPTEIDALLDWLEARGYLSDARFVEGRVRTRSTRYGNLRIRQELAQHGVDIDAATDRALRDSEFKRASEVWLRKFGGHVATVAAERAKQMRFLAGRGFSTDVVHRVVRQRGAAEFNQSEEDDQAA